MKKKYLIVWRLQAFIIITSVLLFPVAAYSQELTEEQKKERCQNNKNRIVELETQLRVIDADFSDSMTKKEMEDARIHLYNVKSVRVGNAKEVLQIVRIGAIYNFKFDECFYRESTEDDPNYNDCATKLEKIIANKIDKAVTLDRLALLAKKNETEKQLASYRTNLIALDCDKQTNKPDKGREEEKDPLSKTLRLTTVHPPGDPYAGTYSIDIEMIQRDGNIKGSGTWSNGATSNFTGTISGGSVTLHRVDISGFSATFWGRVFPDGRMEGTGKNDPASPGGNNSSYTWSAIRK